MDENTRAVLRLFYEAGMVVGSPASVLGVFPSEAEVDEHFDAFLERLRPKIDGVRLVRE